MAIHKKSLQILSELVQKSMRMTSTVIMRRLSTTPPKGDTQGDQVNEQLARNAEAGSMDELVRDFIDPAQFYNAVKDVGITKFYGVPDSLLKDFCAYVTTHTPKESHIITSNEGSAVAMATGYHLASGGTAMVYLQNSGLGNIVNPLMSLASKDVYSIPMLLLVGWRGEPGKRDEPQHNCQGKATLNLLASMGVPVQPLPDYMEGALETLQTAKHHMETTKTPYCLLVRRQTFLPYKLQNTVQRFPLVREEALHCIIDTLDEKDIVVGTTGMLSRELFEYRETTGQGHEKDFLTVGSMGHASGIALGLAMEKPHRQIFCIDGDGAAIMHMGVMTTIGQCAPANFKHILINNGVHDSVGGQPTAAGDHEKMSFTDIAKSCGYKHAWFASTAEEIRASVEKMIAIPGPVMVEIKCASGSRKDLGRPTTPPQQNKAQFMNFIMQD